MPGPKVSTLYNLIQAEIAPIKSAPVPNLTSTETTPDMLYDYIVRSNQAKYKDAKLSKDLGLALDTFSDDELKAFYNKCKGPNIHPQFTQQEFLRRARKKDLTNLLSPMVWGHSDNAPILAAFDELFDSKPELLNNIQNGLAGNAPLPDTSEFAGQKDVEPYKQSVEELKLKLADPDDPQKTAENNALLDEVAENLKVVNPEVREYFDRYDGDSNQYAGPGMQKAQELMKGPIVQEGFKTLGNGQFSGYIEPKNLHGGIQYIGTDDSYWSQTKPFTKQAQDELSNYPASLSDNTINAITNITGTMESMEYKEYSSTQKEQRFHYQPDEEGIFYAGEQGTKYYAFWPLVRAKEDLADAVKSGDIDKIREANEKFKQLDAKTQFMIDETKKEGISHSKYFSGNVNSTRDDNGLLPSKYTTDFVAQNKINSLFNLYAFGKTTNTDVKDILKDPYNSMKKASQNYLDLNGMDSRSSDIGTSFAWGMLPMSGEYDAQWDVIALQLGRGIQGVLGMEPDPKKRAEFAAAFELSGCATKLQHKEEVKLFTEANRIAKAKTAEDAEKLECVYGHAAILPQKDFNLKKMMISMTDPDKNKWRTEYDLNSRLTPQEIAKLNLKELATRPQTVIAQFEEAQQKHFAFKSGFNKNRFLLSSFAAYSKVIQNAPPEVQATEDFKNFKKSVLNMYQLTNDPDTRGKLKAASMTFDEPEPLNTLTRGKEDRFWGSKEDSPEYTRMKNSLKEVRSGIKAIRGAELQGGPQVRNEFELKEKMATAKQDAFDYARLKLKNGTKTSFSEQSGEERYLQSLSTINQLTRMQKEMGFLSPAQEAYEKARMELLINSHDKEWMRANGAKTAATIIYTKSLVDAKIPDEHQADMIRPENMEKEIAAIQQTEPAKSLISGPPHDKMTELIMTESARYKNVVETAASQVKARYDDYMAPKEYVDAVKKLKHYYAIGRVVQEMNITNAADPRYSMKNKDIQKRADEIEKDPQFQQVMDRVIRGKSTKLLKLMTSSHPTVGDPVPGYKEAEKVIEFEDRFVTRLCEEYTRVSNPGKYKDGEKPQVPQEMINMYKKTASVGSYIDKITKGKTAEQIEDMNKDLNDPKKLRSMIINYGKHDLELRNQKKPGPVINGPNGPQQGLQA